MTFLLVSWFHPICPSSVRYCWKCTVHCHCNKWNNALFHAGKSIDQASPSIQLNKSNASHKHHVQSTVPDPLPLVCPGQHLHTVLGKQVIDDGKNPLQDPTTFSLGRLKVILVDGVIYRYEPQTFAWFKDKMTLLVSFYPPTACDQKKILFHLSIS